MSNGVPKILGGVKKDKGFYKRSYSEIMFGDELHKEVPLRQHSNLSSPLRHRLRPASPASETRAGRFSRRELPLVPRGI